ncbi:F1F0 ATP synthase subunit G [Starmerella bacillaris]|uniref:F1F0 ATP synthase subunit G n=1 Tax=Starmerella bacillaris TaxID=1247836 RepID=A0AAV5RLA3_STABA|nr:F1F0 ATP synthase subunit G [Starmerella bacillaris]
MFMRNYSSQATKLVNAGNSLTKGISSLTKTTIFYSKVAGEIGKYVWQKEGMALPSLAEFQQSFTNAYKSTVDLGLAFSQKPAAGLHYARNLKKDDYIKGGAVLIQLAGIFSIGEMIGRGHIYGYKKHIAH